MISTHGALSMVPGGLPTRFGSSRRKFAIRALRLSAPATGTAMRTWSGSGRIEERWANYCPGWRLIYLLRLFCPLTLAETDPGPPILVDKFDAGTVRVPPLPFRLFGLLQPLALAQARTPRAAAM